MGKEFAFLKTPACRDENQEETAGFPATPHPHPQGSWGPWWEVAFPWASVASATHCWFEHPGLFLREQFFTHLFEWFITKKSHSIREHWKLPWLSEEKWQREAGRQQGCVILLKGNLHGTENNWKLKSLFYENGCSFITDLHMLFYWVPTSSQQSGPRWSSSS